MAWNVISLINKNSVLDSGGKLYKFYWIAVILPDNDYLSHQFSVYYGWLVFMVTKPDKPESLERYFSIGD